MGALWFLFKKNLELITKCSLSHLHCAFVYCRSRNDCLSTLWFSESEFRQERRKWENGLRNPTKSISIQKKSPKSYRMQQHPAKSIHNKKNPSTSRNKTNIKKNRKQQRNNHTNPAEPSKIQLKRNIYNNLIMKSLSNTSLVLTLKNVSIEKQNHVGAYRLYETSQRR